MLPEKGQDSLDPGRVDPALLLLVRRFQLESISLAVASLHWDFFLAFVDKRGACLLVFHV